MSIRRSPHHPTGENPTLQLQRDLERLSAENILLKRQNEALQNQLAERAVVPVGNPVASFPSHEPIANVQPHVTNVGTPVETQTTSQRPKVHVVKSGETATSIAAKYGLRLNVLLAANSRIDANRLKPGQTINIPSSSR